MVYVLVPEKLSRELTTVYSYNCRRLALRLQNPIFSLCQMKLQIFNPIPILGVLSCSAAFQSYLLNPDGHRVASRTVFDIQSRAQDDYRPFLSLVQLPSSFSGDLLSEIHRTKSGKLSLLHLGDENAYHFLPVIKQSYHDQARSSSIILSTEFGKVPDQRITNLPWA